MTSDKPLQLISFDNNKRLVVNPEAIAWLAAANQDKHIGVITVVGKYRTGKSYILNRVLLNRNNGFEVGPTINACTKGLWVWPYLLTNPDDPSIQYMVMDTEGLGSLEEGEQSDTRIFLMAMLLSSYFIYNSVGSIDEKAVQSLSLIINLSKLLQKGGYREMQDIINCFPSFLWLVRDFALRLEDEEGKALSPKEYLYNALRVQKGTSEMTVRKNSVRKYLTNFFKERDCFMLIRPVDDEKKLQNMAQVKDNELRPRFLYLIGKLRNKVMGQVRKKNFKGKPCSPAMFVELCQHFCDSINKGGLPYIESNWDLVCRAYSNRVEKRCMEYFERLLKHYSTIYASKINLKNFYTYVRDKIDQSLKYFDKNALGDKADKKRVMKYKMTDDFERLMKKLADARNYKLDRAVGEICQEITAQVMYNDIATIFDISERYDELIERYSQSANSNMLSHLYRKCYEGIKNNAHNYFGSILQTQHHEKNVLQEKLGFCQHSLNRIQDDHQKKVEESDKRERYLRQNMQYLYRKSRQANDELMKAKRELHQLCANRVEGKSIVVYEKLGMV